MSIESRAGRPRKWVEPSQNIKFELTRVLPLGEVERHYVMHVFRIYNGNKTHAAEALGISIRGLSNLLYRWGYRVKKDSF